MEKTMTKRVIEHEIKLQKSVIIILAVLAIGVFANAFAPVFEIKNAQAERGDHSLFPVYIACVSGCN